MPVTVASCANKQAGRATKRKPAREDLEDMNTPLKSKLLLQNSITQKAAISEVYLSITVELAWYHS